MIECFNCGFWDSDYETCTCPSMDKVYACPMSVVNKAVNKSDEAERKEDNGR